MLEQLIPKAFELHDWIAQRLDGLEISRDRRVLLAVSCYDVVIEHQIGIAALIRSRINGSAFSLVRPLFETFVRAAWLRHCASDQQIDEYVKDRLDLKTALSNPSKRSIDLRAEFFPGSRRMRGEP